MEKRKIILKSEKDLWFVVGLCQGIDNIVIEDIDIETQSILCQFLNKEVERKYIEKINTLDAGSTAYIKDGFIHEDIWNKFILK